MRSTESRSAKCKLTARPRIDRRGAPVHDGMREAHHQRAVLEPRQGAGSHYVRGRTDLGVKVLKSTHRVEAGDPNLQLPKASHGTEQVAALLALCRPV